MTRVDDIADKLRRSERITGDEALVMWREAPLWLLGELAVAAKRRVSGDKVYYNRNFHVEPTNLCVFNCRFCSYRRPKGSPEAWDYSLEDIERIVRSHAGSGATEIHIVGGVHPDHDIYYYAEMIRRVKALMPGAAIKAFTAIELSYMIRKAGLPTREGLQLLVDAGMESIPGGGAEIFDEELRARICPGLISTARLTGWDSRATPRYSTATSRRSNTALTTFCGFAPCRTRRAVSTPSYRSSTATTATA